MFFDCKDRSLWVNILFSLSCKITVIFVHLGLLLSNATGKLVVVLNSQRDFEQVLQRLYALKASFLGYIVAQKASFGGAKRWV